MPHPPPPAVKFQKLDDPRLVEMTFFGTAWEGGATTIVPREEAIAWLERWLSSAPPERVHASKPAHNSDDRTNLSPARLEPESNPSDSFFDPIRQGTIT